MISADSMSWSYTVRRDPRPAPTASDTRCYGESGSLATVPPWQLLGSRGGSEALHCAPHRGEELGLEGSAGRGNCVAQGIELAASTGRKFPDTPPSRNVTVAIVSGLGVAVCTES